MAQSKKITDLEKVSPKEGYNFLVATLDENYRVTFPDLSNAITADLNLDGFSGYFQDQIDGIDGAGLADQLNDISGHLQGEIDDIDGADLADQLNDVSGYFEQSINNINIIGGNTDSSFVFFNSIINNNGAEISTYYDTPTPSTHLSGSFVESSSNLRVSLRWDGPNNDYMGTGYINNIEIPKSNIQELGPGTRRFEGYIDNFNAQDSTQLTGVVNGFTGLVDLITIGSGPSASNISIDTINNATPKNGEELGSSALKAGDSINIFIDYDSSLFDTELTSPSQIAVDDYGISNAIPFSSYSFIDVGGSIKRATIPITVSDRVGEQGIKLRATNNMGSTGIYQTSDIDFAGSNDSRLLDQDYPIISASSPSSYNGRTDGLRETESTNFNNTVSNFDDSIDVISYTASVVNNSTISINLPSVFESSKTVSYVNGVHADQDNLNIKVVRGANGATDSKDLTIKVANAPIINSVSVATPAISSASGHNIGLSELKGGDTVNVTALIDTQGETNNSIKIKVFNEGLADGSQTSFASYNSTLVNGDIYSYTVPVVVTSSRNGNLSVKLQAQNQYSIDGNEALSNTVLNNNIGPSVNISSVSYPSGQQAIKLNESATVNHTASNYDSISYIDPTLGTKEISINSPSTFEAVKTCNYNSGTYNINSDNFKIVAIKDSNGLKVSTSTVIKIANEPLKLSITNLASSLSSSSAGLSDLFNLVSDQSYNALPLLSTDSSQNPASQLVQTNSGTGLSSNSFRITVKDIDQKGQFLWEVSAFNLANIETNTVFTNPNYLISGFNQREILASPNSLAAGLASIGTTVTNPSNVFFENVSEGGSGPNGGTIYSFLQLSEGVQLDFSFNHDNKFCICNSSGVVDNDGDHVFNLDALSRAANADVNNPAKYIIKED
jgi:hypothetical protein